MADLLLDEGCHRLWLSSLQVHEVTSTLGLKLQVPCKRELDAPEIVEMKQTHKSTHRGARTHDHKVKSLALCRLS